MDFSLSCTRSPTNYVRMDVPSYSTVYADAGGWSRSQTDQFLKVEMMDELDDDHSVISADDEANRKEEIWKFIAENKQLKDVHVPTMRHLLPQLLMEAYSDHYARYVRKVKGIWKKPPPGWPSDIEFVDPNNKMKALAGNVSRKPKKELLTPMLQHLVKKFLETHGTERASLPVQVETVTEEELRSATEMDWGEELRQHTVQMRTKLLFLRKNNLIDECMFRKLLHMQGVWFSKSNYTEDELCAIHDLNKLLSVIKFRGHVTTQLSDQIDAIAAQNTHHAINPGELNIRQRVNGEGEVSRLMQMQDLEVRHRCTSEQSSFEAAEKLGEGGKVNLVECGTLPELGSDDVESVLSGVEGCGSLPSDTTVGAFASCETDDVASVFSEAENYGCILSIASVAETNMGDAVFQDMGQQPTDRSELFDNLLAPTPSYGSPGIDIPYTNLYSQSPHIASTGINVQSSIAVQGPVSPAFATGSLLQQLSIETTPLAVSGHSGPPLQVIHYAVKPITSPNLENQGVPRGKRMAPLIPSVVEEHESDDDDDQYAAPWVKKPRP